MRIVAFLLLMSICQADLFGDDQGAFSFLTNLNTEKIVKTIENEVSKLVHKTLSPNDVQMVDHMAHDFVSNLRRELEKAVFMVTQSGDLNKQFTNRMLSNLRRAVGTIGGGLEMTQDMMDTFVDDLMKDITHLEETGLLDIDLDFIFQGIVERALTLFEEKTREKRGISPLFDNVNDTIHRVIGTMTGRFQDLQDFFKANMKNSTDSMKPHIENMKILAKNFISNIKSAQTSVLQHAIEFFTPFALKMGDTYLELMSKAQSRLQNLAETPIPAIYK